MVHYVHLSLSLFLSLFINPHTGPHKGTDKQREANHFITVTLQLFGTIDLNYEPRLCLTHCLIIKHGMNA